MGYQCCVVKMKIDFTLNGGHRFNKSGSTILMNKIMHASFPLVLKVQVIICHSFCFPPHFSVLSKQRGFHTAQVPKFSRVATPFARHN